jgi:hypothetical protein
MHEQDIDSDFPEAPRPDSDIDFSLAHGAYVTALAVRAGGQLESFMSYPPKPAMWHFTPDALHEFVRLLAQPSPGHKLGVPAQNSLPGDYPPWIRHDGSVCPVIRSKRVDVIYRGGPDFDVEGYLTSGNPASVYTWAWGFRDAATDDSDIVAYRLRP